MKFKIPKGSDIYNSLVKLFDRGEECKKAAKMLAKEFGAKNTASSNSDNNYFGGVAAFEFDNKPDGWKVVGQSWQKFFMPKYEKKNKPLWDKISALPVVTFDEVNNAVGFPKGLQTVSTGGGIAIIRGVNLARGKDYFLLEVTDGIKYKAPNGVVEILGSEYERLEKLIEASKPKEKK